MTNTNNASMTRTEALRLAKSTARKAGYNVSGVRVLADAKELFRQISGYADMLRIDPYTGTHLGPVQEPAPKLAIEEAKRHLDHGTDGPLSAFVLISRAAELVAKGTDPETVANALHESLDEFCFLRGDAEPVYMGEV